MTAKKAVATIGDSLPETRPTFMGDTVRGNEGVTSDDMSIPRLSIIQDLSPQHKKSKPEYIEGAEVKMIFNTATQQLYGHRVHVVPVLFRKEWVIWKDIDSGGGFRGAHNTEAEAKAALSEIEDAAECQIVDTHQHFVLILDGSSTVDDPKMEQAVISMSKSQCKPSRQWNTLIQSAGGDRFERMYTLDVVDAQNNAGQEYYNWKVTRKGFVPEDVFRAAETLYEAVKTGAMDVKRDADAPQGGHAEGEVGDDDEF